MDPEPITTKAPVTALSSWGRFLLVHHRWSIEVFMYVRGRARRMARLPIPGKERYFRFPSGP